MIILLKLAIVPLIGACVTTDRRDSTSPSSLLHSLFLFFSLLFFCPHPYFFPSCAVFLSSFSTCPAHSHLSGSPHSCYLLIIKTVHAHGHLPVLLPSLQHSHFVSPLSFILSFHLSPCVWWCISETAIPLPLPQTHPLPVCAFSLFILYSISSSASLSLAVTSFPLGYPLSLLLPPSPLVLSQLGCGLDGSGPPLPSPRLQQQHQPQIQVIQQL